MATVNRLARGFEVVLELITAILVVALTAIVIYAVLWRYVGGGSPGWYDEVAAKMLVWLTYYASALAALKRGHIAVDGALMAMPVRLRMAAAVLAEVVVVAFLVVLAWAGMMLFSMVEGMTLISIRWVPLQVTHSVIPIGAVLFLLAQLLSMPAHLARMRAGVSTEQEEIDRALATAGEQPARDHARGPGGETPRQ